MNVNLRDRNNEFAAPFANESILLDDFVLQIPGQNEQKVGLRLANPFRRENRNVRSRQEPPVLIWIAVDGVIQKIRAYGAIIQERVAFAGRAIAGDLLAAALCLNEKIQQFALGLFHLLSKALVSIQAQITGGYFAVA